MDCNSFTRVMSEKNGSRRRRVYYTRCSRLIVAVLVFLPLCTKAEEDMDCLHKYTEQLNPLPNCDPYNRGIMILKCTAEVPRNASDITIGWFLNCEQLTNDTHATIRHQVVFPDLINNIRRIRSRLTISDITDDYAGDYTCNILGEDEYIPSDLFTLHDSDELEVDLPLGPCVNGDVFRFQAEAAEKCADITENRTIPMSLSCEEPPATSSHDTPVTSTPVIHTTPPPLIATSTTSPSLPSTSSPTNIPTPPHSTSVSPSNTPVPTPTIPVVTDPQPKTTPSAVLYAVAALAAVLFMTIIILFVVCVVMWRRHPRGVIRDEVDPKQQVHGKQFSPSRRMAENTDYQGGNAIDSPGEIQDVTIANSSPLHGSDTYNTIGMGDYETVGPGGDYQRLQRPSLTPSMRTRFMTSPDSTAFSPTSTMASMYPLSTTTLNEPIKGNGGAIGIVPPPLPSTSRRGNMGKLPNSPESPDSAFHTGSVDLGSPSDRDRFNSSSMLLPKDRKGSATDFEGLYTPRVQKSASSPSTNHPLQKIPETGASFPEPSNPYPFPTSTSVYESIPGDDSSSKRAVKGYEKPLPSPQSGRPRAVTLPVHSPPISPPPSDNGSRQCVANNQQVQPRDGRAATISPRHPHELEFGAISGPIYHSLEPTANSHVKHNGLVTVLKGSPSPAPVYPMVETADFTLDSNSSASDTLTPGFPVCSADFAELGSGSGPKSKSQKPLRQTSTDHLSDLTGDSDYPQMTDCTGGSSTSAYPDSDWTGGAPNGDGRAFTGNSNVFAMSRTPLSPGRSSTTSSNCTPNEGTPNRSSSFDGGTMNGEMSKGSIPNGRIVSNGPMPNGNCAVIAQYPHHVSARSSRTVPVVAGPTNFGGAASHTLTASRNHYKELDPSTMEPHLKYTTLNVGKLTVV